MIEAKPELLSIKQIEPREMPWRKPKCTALVTPQTGRFRDRVGDHHICNRTAHFLVDGKPLCKMHTGDALILHFADFKNMAAGEYKVSVKLEID